MARVDRNLDIDEAQVAIDFFDDPEYHWHARVLLRKLGDGGRWIVATPDLEVQVCDLSAHRLQVLTRDAPVPARLQGNLYMFDREPHGGLPDGELARLHGEALGLATILGGAAGDAGADTSMWVYSDPANERYGEEVDGTLAANPATMVRREAVALVHTPDGWTTAERLLRRDLEEWKDEKRNGPGRDPRVLPVQRDDREHRYCGLRDAMVEMRKPTSCGADFPYEGPSGIVELLESVRGSGEELGGYHEFWVRGSGIHPESSVAQNHRVLMSVLLHLVSFDQLNAYHLSCAECCARNVLTIHRATKKSPKAPDFKGLEIMTVSRLAGGGSTLHGEFARWTAEKQKDEAFAMKQQRLYAEESGKKPPQSDGGGKK